MADQHVDLGGLVLLGAGCLLVASGAAILTFVMFGLLAPLGLLPGVVCIAVGLRLPGVGCAAAGLASLYLVYAACATALATGDAALAYQRGLEAGIRYGGLIHWLLAPTAVVALVAACDHNRNRLGLLATWGALFAVCPLTVLLVLLGSLFLPLTA